jgi:hypothetical protein
MSEQDKKNLKRYTLFLQAVIDYLLDRYVNL